MFSILGFIFLFILAFIFFGLAIISRILQALFGWGRRNSSSARPSGYNESSPTRENTPKRKKVFKEDEGEYVEFEEVKKEDGEQ